MHNTHRREQGTSPFIRRNQPASRRARASAVHVESLEMRRLLASATLSGGTLTVTGDTGRGNTLQVELTPSNAIIAKFNGQSRTFARSAVQRVVIRGAERNDYFGMANALTLPAKIYGNAGNDTVWAGGGNDEIWAGSGNDQINGRAGNDTVYGESGNDTLDGGSGTDRYLDSSGTNRITNFEVKLTGTTPPTSGGSSGGSTGSGQSPTSPNPNPDPTPDPNPGGGSGGGTGGTPLPGTGSGGTPSAVISVVGSSSIPAGHAVHVNGLSSQLNAGSPLTARYEWNFGDAGSKYNTLVGFNAAHVYDRPGNYTITLRVTNEAGKTDTTTRTVTVGNAGRRVIYVSGSGSDGNSGGSEGSAVRSLDRAFSLAGGGNSAEILLRRGDTYSVNSMRGLSGSNLVVGAWGSGSNPVIRWDGARIDRPIFQVNGTNITFKNLTFTSRFTDTDKSSMPDALNVGGRNITVRESQFLNIGSAINANSNPTGVLAVDNSAPSVVGIRSYFAWVQGSDHVYLGNRVANSTREAPLRIFEGAKRILLHGNDLTNLSRVSAGDRFDTAKNSLTAQWGDYVYATGNRFSRGPIRLGPLGDGDGYQWRNARANYLVLENNLLDGPSFVEHGAQHVIIRNNVSIAHGMPAYTVDGYDSSYGRGVVNLTVVNNTAVNNSTIGQFLLVGGSVNGINLVNNLYSAPKLQPGAFEAAPVYVNGSSLSSFRTVSNNVWARGNPLEYAQGGMNYIWTRWSDSRGYHTADRWNNLPQVGTDFFGHVSVDSRYAPASGSLAAGNGRLYGGVFTDYHGKVRPTNGGNWTVGAVQL